MKMKWQWKVLICVLLLAAAVFARPVAREVRDGIREYRREHTKIPKLYLSGDISQMNDKKDVRQIAFTYNDGNEEISGYAKIKPQGTSSMMYEKKNYTLNFYEDESFEKELNIDVGWGPQNKYCMKANWIDRTHARNVVTAKLATKVQSKYNLLAEAPRNGLIDGFPIEIFDNGEFLGVYTFNIPKDAWQFAMDESNPDHIVICGEGWDDANLFLAEPDFETWSVEVGEESEETLQKMNRLFNFVVNATDEEFKENFSEYLNLDSALNYYVMADLAYMGDNLGKNMLIATYDGMEWYLSLYDLDTTWGTDWKGDEAYEFYSVSLLDMSRSNLFARMEKAFSKELAERYFELRQDLLSNENIMAEFEAFRAMIPAGSFEKEALRWSPHENFRWDALPGADYDQIQRYLDAVSDRLDAKYSAWLAQ